MSALKRIAQGAALAVLASGSALAADLPRRTEAPAAPVYAPPMFTWTGFYVGLNAGAAIGDSRYQYAPFFNSYAQSGLGFTGGGQIGYNWQTGPLVLGVETDINYRSASSSSGNSGFGASNNTSGYFGTVRGRVGYAIDRALLFATGGFAGSRNTATVTNIYTGFWGQQSSFQTGWALGAGVEFMLTNNLSAKAEYLFTAVGSDRYFDYSANALQTSVNNSTVKGGLNYHF